MPPGGQATIEKLADLMGVEVQDSAHDLDNKVKMVAFIHEDMCIGCTKCIQACPVDAIVGGNKAVHTVIKMSARVVTCASRLARPTVLK